MSDSPLLSSAHSQLKMVTCSAADGVPKIGDSDATYFLKVLE
jgi:hypothetical protein